MDFKPHGTRVTKVASHEYVMERLGFFAQGPHNTSWTTSMLLL